MENEENRGLIDKKDSKDQFVTFCQFIFGALSLFSRSLLETYSFLGVLQQWSKEGNASKGKERKRGSRKEEKDQSASVEILAGNIFHV